MYICRIGGFGLLSYIVKSTVRVTGKEAINVLHDQLMLMFLYGSKEQHYRGVLRLPRFPRLT